MNIIKLQGSKLPMKVEAEIFKNTSKADIAANRLKLSP